MDTMNTENNAEMKKEVEETSLHRLAKVHDVLDMWQGSQNLPATQMESRAQSKQMTAMVYVLDTEDMVEASWSLFQHNHAAVFQPSERSPSPPPLTAQDVPGGRTQISNMCQIRRMHRHPVESD